jgi:hypothetical protein
LIDPSPATAGSVPGPGIQVTRKRVERFVIVIIAVEDTLMIAVGHFDNSYDLSGNAVETDFS